MICLACCGKKLRSKKCAEMSVLISDKIDFYRVIREDFDASGNLDGRLDVNQNAQKVR